MIIGLAGYAGSGKSTVAEILAIDSNGVPRALRLAFADPIKKTLKELYNLSDEQLYGNKKFEIDPRYNLTPREMMQKFGTEVCRQIYPETWTNYLKIKIQAMPIHFSYIIEDVRYENEVRTIKSLGGVIWQVKRKNRPIISGAHSSEIPLPPETIDAIIINDGSKEELRKAVEFRLTELANKLKVS